MREADLVVCQLISDNYKGFPIGTNQIKAQMKSRSRAVTYPNAYFEGYAPYFTHIKDCLGRKINPALSEYSMYPSEYHDALAIAIFLEGGSFRQLMDIYEQKKVNPYGWIEKNLALSLQRLRSREEKCDIKISDFILNGYKESQLFWTFNHPSNVVLNAMAERILLAAGIPIPEGTRMLNREMLGNHVLPVFDFVSDYLSLRFSKSDWMIARKKG